MSAKAETFSVRLSDDLKRQVDRLAKASKRSRSYIVNEAVESYVNNQAAYMRGIEQAVKGAEAGIGHSSEQVFSWLDAWAGGTKLPIPKPDILPTK